MVFAGYGISASELKYDDYAATNAKDMVAVVFPARPMATIPMDSLRAWAKFRFKAAAAQAAGARALIIIASEPELKNDRLSRLTYDNAGEASIPIVVVSRQLAQQIVSPAKLSDYESVADSRTATRKPDPNANPLNEGTETNIPQDHFCDCRFLRLR